MSKKRKIIYVITKSNWGGAQRYVYDLATHIPKRAFHPIVACGGNGPLVQKLTHAGIEVITIPFLDRDVSLWNEIKVLFFLIKMFKKEQPAYIHLNSSKIGLLGSLAGRAAKVPRILFTAHNWVFNEERPFLARLGIKFLHFLTIALCHDVIAVSRSVARQGVHISIRSKKISIIHNGVPRIRFKMKQEAREQLALRHPTLGITLSHVEKPLWIGTVAELHKNKGLEYALKALALLKKSERPLPPFILTIIGEGEERARLEELTKEAKLEQIVFFLGHVDTAAQYIKAFDIFLFPSINEALPYAPLEAGLAELPVIASNVGGIPEIIEDMKSGILLKPRDPGEIAHALSFLMLNKDTRLDLGKNLETRVHTEFSVEKMLEKTIAVYDTSVILKASLHPLKREVIPSWNSSLSSLS